MSDYAQATYIVDEVLAGIDGRADTHTGIPPHNMKKMQVASGDKCVRLTFTEPDNTVIDDQLICTVKGVVVVRKQGSMPENINDGIVILTNEELGKYSQTPFVDTGLTNEMEYFYRFFPYSDHGVYNTNSVNVKSATPKEYILYGFKIDKNNSDPATRITYLEMAAGMTPAKMDYTNDVFDYGSWDPDSIWFLADNKPYMVNPDGTPEYELDPNDYTKKIDGSASDISLTNHRMNAMAKIPLVWLKQWEDENYEYCYVCNVQLDASYHAYAHQREDGSVMDYIWISCCDGALLNGKVRSLKGQTTMNSQTGTNEITYAEANGELYHTRTWAQRNLINALLYLMGCSDATQTVYGNGHYTGGSSASNLLKTGTLSDKGRFYGTNGTGKAVKVFHIENWWGNAWERIAGLINNKGKIVVKMTPPYNTTGDGYTDTGLVPAGTSGGYISKTSMTEYGRIGYHAAGSQTTYACDGLWFDNSQIDYALVGGSCAYGFLCGASCLYVAVLVSDTGWNLGAALSCEQPLEA